MDAFLRRSLISSWTVLWVYNSPDLSGMSASRHRRLISSRCALVMRFSLSLLGIWDPPILGRSTLMTKAMFPVLKRDCIFRVMRRDARIMDVTDAHEGSNGAIRTGRR